MASHLESEDSREPRSLGVDVVGALTIFSGVFGVYAVLATLLSPQGVRGPSAPVERILIDVIYVGLGVALLCGMNWARWVLGAFAVASAASVVAAVLGSGDPGSGKSLAILAFVVPFAVLVVITLFSRSASRFFKRSRKTSVINSSASEDSADGV
ncbi:MAG TPA: hypothetical protein VGM19_04565 [Armatimonadota bacterium]|jgi:hypothetical protein